MENESSSLVSEIKNMSMLLSMMNFSASNLFWIELIFRWPKINLSDNWAFISLSLDFASRAPVLDNEDGDSCKLSLLLKIVKIGLFPTTGLGRLVLISKYVVWSSESEDPLKRIVFAKKNCLAYLQNSDLILIYQVYILIYQVYKLGLHLDLT